MLVKLNIKNEILYFYFSYFYGYYLPSYFMILTNKLLAFLKFKF